MPTPPRRPCLQWGLCPCVLHIPRRGWEARSVPPVPGRGTASPVPCPFPSSWPLQSSARLPPARCPAASGGADPVQPSARCVRVPRPSARGVCSVLSVLTRNKEMPVVCRNGKILTVVK